MSDKPQKERTRRPKKERSAPLPAVEVMARNQAVYAIYRRLIPIALLSVLSASVAVFAAFSLWSIRTPPQYIQVQEDGRLIQEPPLSENSVSQGLLSDFAIKAIRALNTYDYINWRQQIQAASDFFSPRGWDGYIKAFEDVRTIDAVTKRKMVVSVEPTGPVTFSRQGKVATGEYAWRLEVPVKVTYTPHDSDSASPNVQDGTVIMAISRIPVSISPRGYAIQLYVFRAK
jgi:intracellular multiplication protein IcmL